MDERHLGSYLIILHYRVEEGDIYIYIYSIIYLYIYVCIYSGGAPLQTSARVASPTDGDRSLRIYLFIYSFIYLYVRVPRQHLNCTSGRARVHFVHPSYNSVRPISLLTLWISEGLTET